MATLKHAFEAGNMKGLVLKILRGKYPKIPSFYSVKLRELIDKCLRREPRDRPVDYFLLISLRFARQLCHIADSP
jgi:NIMA (never in mitosis gene a)-related kinase